MPTSPSTPPALDALLPPKSVSLEEALLSARETRALVVGRGTLTQTAAVFRAQFPGTHAVVVCDRTTLALAGGRVLEVLRKAGLSRVEPFVFNDPDLYAEYGFVERLETSLRTHDAIPVAVGSGTVNDLVKLAAHRLERPYLCIATAASMDGYTAFGASITFKGAKQTFNCAAPRAVIADTTIICAAPPSLTASGYADLMAKITAGADWLLADALGVEAIEPRAWSIVQGGLRHALADPAGARAGRQEAIVPLIEGLMLGGFAMQAIKSSRPASGAEHQFSHLWDMEHHVHQGVAPSHGFKVGIATLAVTALYETLLRIPFENLDVVECCARWPHAQAAEAHVRQLLAGTDFIDTGVTETLAKHSSIDALRLQLERLRACWPDLRQRLLTQLIPFAELKERLRQVGAPTEPEEIGLSRQRLRDSFQRALLIRRRFTVLDLAARTGQLEISLSQLFGPGGIWAINPSAPSGGNRHGQ